MKVTNLNSNRTISSKRRLRLVQYYLGHISIYLGVLLIVLVTSWLVVKAARIYVSYQTFTQQTASLETALKRSQSIDAKTEAGLREAAVALEALYQEAAPFLPVMHYLGWLPIYGDDLQALPALLGAGRDLSQVVLIGLDMAAPLLEVESEGGQVPLLPYAVTNLRRSETELEQLEQRLRTHQQVIADIEPSHLSPALAGRVRQIKAYLPGVIAGVGLARNLPALLGANSPQTYLILTQNEEELRPTGGYINTAGHIVFEQGQIVEFVMQDSYAVDRLTEAYPYPPDPLRQYMAADYWVLRDASWSPDFPTMAQTAIDLYALGQGITADGVLSFDQQALVSLLQALGPLDVDGDRVTAKNVIRLLRQHWTPGPGQTQDRTWWRERKSFMLRLAEEMKRRLETELTAGELPRLTKSVAEAVAEKHLLIYLETPAWTALAPEQNWAGALTPTSGDYLMVVDANVGFNKASALVERRITYRLTLAPDGGAQAHLNLFYHHPAPKQSKACWQKPRYDLQYKDNMLRCYWDYVRVIAPVDARLLTGPRVIVEGQYLLRGESTPGKIDREPVGTDKISWGQLFLLAPEESISLDYTYTLPPGTAHYSSQKDAWRYTLYLQKQPGALESAVEVMITLPSGARLIKNHPLPADQDRTDPVYTLSLKTDQKIEIVYTLP